MNRVPEFLLAAYLAFHTSSSLADDTSAATAQREGFSALKLNAITTTIQRDVDATRLPGAVLLIARNGKLVHANALGKLDPAKPTAMPRDAIFRIYSMTKPIVSVAVMMMIEDGRVLLGEPVSTYLPELKTLKLGVERSSPDGTSKLEAVKASREMLVYDLLRHTSGLTYGFEGKSLVKDEYKKLGLDGGGNVTTIEWLAKVAGAPLQNEPGTKWEYSIATDVLGALLERVSGQSLDVHLQERVFKPLSMKDTSFSVAAEKQYRVADGFEIDPVWKIKYKYFDTRQAPVRSSGGGGALSTADDYLRFLHMLLNGGELDGVRLLSPKTVNFMLADHLSGMRARQPAGTPITGPRPGYSFGLGFAIRNELGDSVTLGSAGSADWNGLGGPNFWIDPKEKLAVVWMAQAAGLRPYYRQLLPNLVYGAMVK